MIPLEELRKEYREAERQYHIALDLKMELEFYAKRYKEASEAYSEALRLTERGLIKQWR